MVILIHLFLQKVQEILLDMPYWIDEHINNYPIPEDNILSESKENIKSNSISGMGTAQVETAKRY